MRESSAQSVSLSPYPFHCWASKALPYVTRFTVGLKREEERGPLYAHPCTPDGHTIPVYMSQPPLPGSTLHTASLLVIGAARCSAG